MWNCITSVFWSLNISSRHVPYLTLWWRAIKSDANGEDTWNIRPTTNTMATQATMSAWVWMTNSWLNMGGFLVPRFFIGILLPKFHKLFEVARSQNIRKNLFKRGLESWRRHVKQNLFHSVQLELPTRHSPNLDAVNNKSDRIEAQNLRQIRNPKEKNLFFQFY